MRKSGRTREAQKSLFYFFEEISDIKHEKILRLSLVISDGKNWKSCNFSSSAHQNHFHKL